MGFALHGSVRCIGTPLPSGRRRRSRDRENAAKSVGIWWRDGYICRSGVFFCEGEEPAAFSHTEPSREDVRNTPIRRSTVWITAPERVAKLETALAVLHGVDGPEVESLRVALKRCEEMEGAAELDAKRTVSASIYDAEKRLEQQMQQFFHISPVDAESELRQLLENCRSSWKVSVQRWRRDKFPSAFAGEKISFSTVMKSCRSGSEEDRPTCTRQC